MNIFGINPMMYYQLRRQELLKEVAQYRLVKEALNAGMPKARSTSKILALIGRKLASLGVSLEGRYGVQPKIELSLNRQSSPGGC